MGQETYTLVQLAEAVGMSPRNVRAYQARGLIGPPRRSGRSVVYDDDHRRRLVRVRAAVTQGVSLKRLAALLAEDRLADLEEVVRGLRPGEATTIDLTGSLPRQALHPGLVAHLEEVAAETLATLVRLGVLVRDGQGLTAGADLCDPLHELYRSDAPVLPHALATAVAAADTPDGGASPGADAAAWQQRTTRVIDLVHRLQWAVVASARAERALG